MIHDGIPIWCGDRIATEAIVVGRLFFVLWQIVYVLDRASATVRRIHAVARRSIIVRNSLHEFLDLIFVLVGSISHAARNLVEGAAVEVRFDISIGAVLCEEFLKLRVHSAITVALTSVVEST